jgi:voltage-gated potassium channel
MTPSPLFKALALASLATVQRGGGGVPAAYGSLKDTLRAVSRRDPLDAVLGLVTVASAAFYAAERDVNPKVKTMADAVTFITTCLSVGYSDVFARTEAGKYIASFVMTVGPALAARALDPPERAA